jgi:hypothetical protein
VEILIYPQWDKVLCKWFTALHSNRKPVTGLSKTEKAKPVCNEMKITEKCTFSDGWLCSKKKSPLRN